MEPYRIAQVERYVFPSLGEFPFWDRFDQIKAPVLVLYGYQDFEPITQAYVLRDWMPHTRIRMINRCGHWPWLEQPDAFFEALEDFLLQA